MRGWNGLLRQCSVGVSILLGKVTTKRTFFVIGCIDTTRLIGSVYLLRNKIIAGHGYINSQVVTCHRHRSRLG